MTSVDNPGGSFGRILSPLVYLPILVVALLIPLKIIGQGYEPSDDARRHAAKAVSGKDWDEILLLRDSVTTDSHPGWHALLGALHKVTGWKAKSLLLFSVVFLFLLVAVVPLFCLERKEAWVLSLMTMTLASPETCARFLIGRPFLITAVVLLVLCFLWKGLREEKASRGLLILLTVLVALSVWMHAGWGLYAFPLACFFLARQWRAGWTLLMCTAIGVLLGASLSGDPLGLLRLNLYILTHGPDQGVLGKTLVSEFQPIAGDLPVLFVLVGMLFWRALRGRWTMASVDNPVFVMALLGYVLSFVVGRFWYDWGFVAALAWTATEFEDVLNEKLPSDRWPRVALALGASAVLYLAFTSNLGGRWSERLGWEVLSYEKAGERERTWFPDPGGVFYSSRMQFFFDTFLENPHGHWRYATGFEPALMPDEDLAVLRNIRFNNEAFEAFRPWASKLRPGDRLVIVSRENPGTTFPDLEWARFGSETWIGRRPRQTGIRDR